MNIFYGAQSTSITVWEIVSGIIGILGFLLASALAVLEWRRYHIPLRMRLREVRYVGSTKDTHLVLLLLTFVNESSVGKVAYSLLGGAPNKGDLLPCPPQYQQGQTYVVCQLPNSEKAVQIPLSELLWTPLDIPSHQSETKWYPALIKKKADEGLHPSIHIRLAVMNVVGKELARLDEKVELKTHIIY